MRRRAEIFTENAFLENERIQEKMRAFERLKKLQRKNQKMLLTGAFL